MRWRFAPLYEACGPALHVATTLHTGHWRWPTVPACDVGAATSVRVIMVVLTRPIPNDLHWLRGARMHAREQAQAVLHALPGYHVVDRVVAPRGEQRLGVEPARLGVARRVHLQRRAATC